MATYKTRGNTHNVIYPYKTETGAYKQQWESYETELEAVQRKAYIDYLQKGKRFDELLKVVMEYKRKRAIERSEREMAEKSAGTPEPPAPAAEDNTYKTYAEFAEKWLPFHTRKNRLSPNTYDSYSGNLRNHILPYFGNRVMSTITAEDIDNFVDYLSKKPCLDRNRYGHGMTADTLSSASVKKCYNILNAGFPVAKKWRYITEIPATTAPAEKTQKRKAWDPGQVQKTLDGMKEDKLIHLAVHLAFVCSMRARETAGISVKTLDFHDRSMWITQEVQRVSDEALSKLPSREILLVFPKQVPGSKSSMILKGPKTEGSHRKQYLTTPLLREIRERLDEINRCKEFFGEEYHDYGLLICHPDGRPVDPKSLDKSFKKWQSKLGIESQIEFQGLRKSGQMHKVRLTKNNYQLVAESGGQSPEVLMSNYNEALDSEKRTLSLLVETSFYPQAAQGAQPAQPAATDMETVLQAIQSNPEFSKQLMQLLLANAVGVSQGERF
ncbi:MAG: tyrosine-type recombinase/integrase [Oscillospiraceae bacterium]|nr:tyrosine-type recombinase/integrase [Oscillospiraceae bacterium]